MESLGKETSRGEEEEIAIVLPREERAAGRYKATSGLRKGPQQAEGEQPLAGEEGKKERES